jgi:hypothetical protein
MTEYSIDLVKLEETLAKMDPSRHRMYQGIVNLNNVRKRLMNGEVWSGQGAEATLQMFTQALSKALVEEKRLNELAFALTNYIKELKENEESVAAAATAQI